MTSRSLLLFALSSALSKLREPLGRLLRRILGRRLTRDRRPEPGDEPRPAIVVQQSPLLCVGEASMNETQPRASPGIVRLERHLDGRRPGRYTHARIRPSPGEDNALRPLDGHIVPLAVLARHQLEAEAP